MFKKVFISLLMVVTLFSSYSTFVQPNEAKAASYTSSSTGWKKDCKRTSTGTRCGNEYKDTTITIKYTAADAKRIYKDLEKATGGVVTAGIIGIGLKSTPAGLVLSIGQYKLGTVKTVFHEAVIKKKGVTYTYKYRQYKGRSQSATIKVLSKNLRVS